MGHIYSKETSYRRYWLDRLLYQNQPYMRGVVIDLGGKRVGGKNTFRPPEDKAVLWLYVNIDIGCQPCLVADIMKIPLSDQVADCVICTEVLEHLSNPQACIDEAYRLLKPGRILLASVPFMYPEHAAPYDFSRFTRERIRRMCQAFHSLEIYPMGGFLGTLGMLMEQGRHETVFPPAFRKMISGVLYLTGKWLCKIDLRQGSKANPPSHFTTGYFFLAEK